MSSDQHASGAEAAGPAATPRWETIAVVLIAAYYLVRLVYFAATIAPDLPPDEPTHIGIIRLYAEAPLLIEDSPDSYPLGLVTRVPYLYHLLLGKLLAANVFGVDDHLYLRLWNVLLSLLTLAVAYRISRLLTGDPKVRVLFLVLATNTLMLTFLAAAISYDNLVNLLAATSLWMLLLFFRSGRPSHLLAFLLSTMAATLAKLTALPLALILVAVLLAERRRGLATDLGRLVGELRRRRPGTVVLAVLVLALAIANLSLYGGNLLRFGCVNPSCDAVLEEAACMQNRIFARNRIVTAYRKGELSFEEAARATVRIPHPGDRQHALRLLDNERRYQMSKPQPLNLYEYAKASWSQALKPTIFGIQAHRSMLRDPNSLLFYNLIFLAGLLLWARTVSWKGSERLWVYLAAIVVAYVAVVVGWVNYRGYLTTHAPFLGVQGRYLFPVILPAYLLLARSLLKPFGRHLRTVVLVIVAAAWIWGDFPYFSRRADSEWFASGASTAPTAAGERP